jgi:hypothetical protein
MQAVVRPSALPVLKNYQNGTLSSDAASSPENDSAPSPIYDRQRRAGSTPTRSIPAPGFFRSSIARHGASTTAIHLSSLTHNNNNNNTTNSKLKTQTSIPAARSTKNVSAPAGTESPKEALSRRHSARAGLSTAISSSHGRNGSNSRSSTIVESVTTTTNPPCHNNVKNVATSTTAPSSGGSNNTNNQKSNLARCSITRAIVTKLQLNTTTTKTKGTGITI